MNQKILTRDFILAFLVQFVSSFVFNILIPALPIYLSRSGSSEVETGVLIGIFFLSSLILRPFVGKALLNHAEKTFMAIGALLYALSSISYLLTPPFWPFLIVRVLHGIGFAFVHTASITLIANISSGAHRGQTLGYFYMASTVSGALAPSLGMFLINYFSFTVLFLFCLSLSLCLLFITNRLSTRQVARLQESPIENRFFLTRESIPPSISNSFSLFIWGALGAFFPLYAIHHGVTNPGFFFTTVAIMLILGRVLGAKALDLYNRDRIILLCLIAYIISMVLLAFSKTLSMFIVVAVIWGIGNAFLGPALVVYALGREGSPPGPAMGTFTAISDLGLSLGPVIMGIILQFVSYPMMFLCLALTGIINLNYFYFFVRRKG